MCVVLVKFVGKRKLTFFSTFGCSFCFFSTAIYALFIDHIPGEIPKNNIISNVTDSIRDAINSTYKEIAEIMTVTDSNTTEYVSEFQDTSLSVNETLANITDIHSNQHSWIPLSLLLVSALLSHSGIRLLPWMLIGEIFPTKIRGISSGISGATGYVFGFLANKLFLSMVAGFTLPGTFLLYSGISVIGSAVLYVLLPGKLIEKNCYSDYATRLWAACIWWLFKTTEIIFKKTRQKKESFEKVTRSKRLIIELTL